jgi:glyoxylase-like metal-dependent hydrolase (beta-lactamase superfamily II)
MVITKGEREIQLLYPGIGNTSGDAVVYLPKEKILIPGDLVVHPSPYESGMFSPEWLETSQKLAALDFNILIPGHGEVQRGKSYLNFLNAYFAEIIRQVRNAYINNGISGVDDLKKVVTHKTVTDELAKVNEFKPFLEKVDASFVPAAIQTSFRRIIQGKK